MTEYTTLPASSRIWIYQSTQPIFSETASEIQKHLQVFVQQWTAHNQALRAHGELKHNQFVILMVDESQAGASGCSIDKSVHFIQQLEQNYNLSLMDRLNFAYEKEGAIHTAQKDYFAELYQNGDITDDTIVFDNLVRTKGEFDTGWRKKLGESWHKRMV